MNCPVIIVHGGAGAFREGERAACVAGCQRAALAGWEHLTAGAPALDAVEAAVRVLEDDPVFDAGRGSYFNRAGVVQMDAIIMDGRTLNLGAIAAVERILHPITLARHVMEHLEHNFIVGRGAIDFALDMGMTLCDPEDLMGTYAPEDPKKTSDTVGAVALDLEGNVAVATSTGGTSGKWPGRVGDSPLVGSGGYADNLCGAASATGEGEKLMRLVISKLACDQLGAGKPAQDVADAVICALYERTGGHGGVILLDHSGNIGLAHNTRYMPYAYITAEQALTVDMEVKFSKAWRSRDA